MSSKIIDTETFDINDSFRIECEMKRTRSGTRENATIYIDGSEVSNGTDFWSNRPWYRYTYQNAIRDALQKSKRFNNDEITELLDGLAAKDMERFSSMFKTVSAIAAMGELLTEDKKERNDWKARMLKAGLSGISIPEDWDTLDEDEKERRLNKVIALGSTQ